MKKSVAVRFDGTAHYQAESFRGEEQSQDTKPFGERHTDDGLNEDFAGGSRIPSDRFGGFLSDEAHADGGAEQSKRAGNIAGEFSDGGDHCGGFVVVNYPPCARLARSRRQRISDEFPRRDRFCHRGRDRLRGWPEDRYRPRSEA